MDRQQTEPEEGESVPIRCGAFVDRQEKIKNEHRGSKPHQEQHLELLIYASPAPNDAPSQRDKEKWRIDQKMLAEKRKNFARMETNTLLDAATRPQMPQRNPGVLPIPHD